MTAEVAILNSHGIAISADSAVSIGLKWGESKIYYTAEKIFCLNPKRPIGIMIYSDAEFMNIGMDILINEYSKDFDRKKFSTLDEYFKDFLNFISEFKYITIEDEIAYFRSICYTICRHIRKLIDDLSKKIEKNDVLPGEDENTLNTEIDKVIDNAIEEEIDVGDRLLKYSFSNNFKEIEKHINIRTGKIIDLSNVDWKLNEGLSEKVMEAMNKNNSEYSMTTYIEGNTRRIVINRRWQDKYFIHFANAKISKIDTLKLSEIERAQLLSSALTVRLKELESEDATYVYEEYVDDKFVQNHWKEIQKDIVNIFEGFKLTETDMGLLYRIIKLDIQKLETNGLYRYIGIVFVGYGDDDMLPSICDCRLFGRLGKNLIRSERNANKIDIGGSMIYPFAQTDVINTFIRGIDPSFERKIEEELWSLIFNIADKLELKFDTEDDETFKAIEPLVDAKEQFLSNIQKYKEENFTDPIFSIVSSLPRINLAEMAEALINITSLRRHVSSDSESVGGPTDVAIISKTDGFTWIKRKNL